MNIQRRAILELEEVLRELPQLDQQVTHYFAKGLYARQLFIPKGAILTGKIHRHDCLNIVPLGRIAVATEDGSKIVEAPYVSVSPAGTKRAGLALEDTIWITVHASGETDLERLEDELIVPSFEQFALEQQVVRECDIYADLAEVN